MFFLSMLIGVSLICSTAYAGEGSASEVTAPVIEAIASQEGLDGLKRLLLHYPEQKERIRVLANSVRERGSVSANIETEHALFDFCTLLADPKGE